MTETEWLDVFANNLISLLQDRRMSQRDLADEANIADSTISEYVRKRKIPSLRSIINISYALDVDVDELIDFGSSIE